MKRKPSRKPGPEADHRMVTALLDVRSMQVELIREVRALRVELQTLTQDRPTVAGPTRDAREKLFQAIDAYFGRAAFTAALLLVSADQPSMNGQRLKDALDAILPATSLEPRRLSRFLIGLRPSGGWQLKVVEEHSNEGRWFVVVRGE